VRVTTGGEGGRPMVMGRRGVVSSGHYLATECGMHVLRSGGNAVDAAAATGFALALLKPHQNGVGGEIPTLLYDAASRKVHALSGHGIAPRGATMERFRALGIEVIPGDGFLPAVVPSSVGSWIRLLESFGTWRVADVLEPVVYLAREGFPMYDALRSTIAGMAERFRTEWPTSAELYLPDRKVPPLMSVFRNPGWATTFQRLVDADRQHKGRSDGCRAAYELFYGDIARAMVLFSTSTSIRDASGRSHTALLSEQDFSDWSPRFEEAPSVSYRGITVHKCGPWTQGPVLLQALMLVGKADLRRMGQGSAEYIHTVTECMKLAFADRELHYGDPLFAKVPLEELLSEEYAAKRFRLVDPGSASHELRPGQAGLSATWRARCGRRGTATRPSSRSSTPPGTWYPPPRAEAGSSPRP
jgi:gamma-glutamyltranspeptidase/glutathione hydrolase